MSKELLTIVKDDMNTLFNPVLVQRNTPFMYRGKMMLINKEESACSECDLYRPHMLGIQNCDTLCVRIKLEIEIARSFKIIE